METQTARRKNLNLLIGVFLTQRNLEKAIGIDRSTISSYVSGSGSGQISDGKARQIERKLKKPEGWMDRDNYSQNITKSEWGAITMLRGLDSTEIEAFFNILTLFSRRKTI